MHTHTMHTHIHIHTHTHTRLCEEHGCGGSRQLQAQQECHAVCGWTPVSGPGTMALEEIDLENYLIFIKS